LTTPELQLGFSALPAICIASASIEDTSCSPEMIVESRESAAGRTEQPVKS